MSYVTTAIVVSSQEVYATVRITEALESGRITTSQYAQLRYNIMGRSDVFQSFLVPLARAAARRLGDLVRTLGVAA
jgi:hypothetical protein